MIEKIADIINNHTYVVDEWLIDRLNQEFNKGNYSNRKNVDALALELTAKRIGTMTTLDKLENESYQWRHDWAYSDDILIDLKRRPSKYSNICLTGVLKMVESYNMNQLTHIVAFSQNIENNYEIGQVLKFKFEGMLPLKDAIKTAIRTNGDYRLLNINHLQQL
jgi:hypothetical protein